MLPQISYRAFLIALVCLVGSTLGAPEPKNFLFEDAYSEITTETPVTEPVTSVEYINLDNENNYLTGDGLMAQPSEPAENILASASSTSSASSTNNAIGGGSGKNTATNQQANLLLLQQLQQQLQRQQQFKTLLQQQQQVNQQPQQPQFSIDALLKSFVKVFQVAKTKIDQGARTVRDIMQFFDRKKYTSIVPQASETNLVLT